MASVSLTATDRPTTQSWDRKPWPLDPGRRWALRLICALPLVAIALAAARSGFASPELADLAERADTVRSSRGLSELSLAYPPIPTLLAAVLPGGARAISVISALSGGVALQLVLARLVRRKVGLVPGMLLVITLVCSPALWFQATQNPAQFMALMFLVVAIDGFVRFIVRDDTAGGFTAGVALAGAFLCDPVGLVYAVALASAAPVLARRRGFGGQEQAVVLVLIFPTISMMLSWAFLEWRFTGAAFATVWRGTEAFRFDGTRDLSDVVGQVGSIVLASVVYVISVLIVARRRRRAVAALAVPLLAISLTSVLGLQVGPGPGVVLLTVTAMYGIPCRLSTVERYALSRAAVAQVVVMLNWNLAAGDLEPFLDAVF